MGSKTDSTATSKPTPTAAELHAALQTNTESKFSPFNITLSNGASLSGIFYNPTPMDPKLSSPRPLLVGIHGATCCAYNWDVSPSYTASKSADLFDVLFVAFNRPNFLDSSGWIINRAGNAPLPAIHDDYFAEEGRWFHEYIFPALWANFGKPNGCSAIVTTSHSMSVPGTIIAAGLYGAEVNTNYVWAGCILTGHGVEPTQTRLANSAVNPEDKHPAPEDIPLGQDDTIHLQPFRGATKLDLMLGPEGLADATLRPLVKKQTTPFLIGEIMGMVAWPDVDAEYMAKVTIPVLYALGSHDWVWKAERRTADAFASKFVNSKRVEGAMINGAGHTLELSPVSRGWWARACGWALEVTESLASTNRPEMPPPFE